MAALQKPITPPQGSAKTGMSAEFPAAATSKPQYDPHAWKKAGAAIPKTDVVVNGGASAVAMTPGAPVRNQPTRRGK